MHRYMCECGSCTNKVALTEREYGRVKDRQKLVAFECLRQTDRIVGFAGEDFAVIDACACLGPSCLHDWRPKAMVA